MDILCVFWVDLLNYRLLIIIDCFILVLAWLFLHEYVLKVHEYVMCVLSWFAYLLNFRMLIICMNVLVYVIYAINVGIYFLYWLLVLWQLNSAQRGTCHMRTGCRGPEVKTHKCMHKYHLDMYLYCMTCFIVLYLCNFIMHIGLKSSWELMLCCYKMCRL